MFLGVEMILCRLYEMSNFFKTGLLVYSLKALGLIPNAQSMKSQHFFTKARGAIFLLSILFFSSVLAAPPKKVYRVDDRPPDEIFSTENTKAFAPWGENDYLLAHVLGVSLRQLGPEGSAFVATAETLEAARQVAQTRFRLTPPTQRVRPLYIYEIRAEQNFYEVDRYMEALERNPPEDESRRDIAFARSAFRYQREWVAFGGITNAQVRLARRIYFNEDTLQIEEDGVIENEHFVAANTRANDGIFPLQGMHPLLGRQAFILNSTVEFLSGFAVSLAYCPPPAVDRKIRLKVAESNCNNPTVIHLDRDLTGLNEILPILLNED
ncbi:hypothetical protein AWM79_23880 [Pseudomonas agarici]|uniref:Pertussis toxin subunit 1 n=1 Tax=Pseudomonas agarici TaxID=46677 RepID=A0A0X1T8K9_PSEAA|nr:hypothetical protein [Pseudomonas agarici]AMB88149.1 hypothetical protein AWM79_23880 [Pseudomonas agarici]NWB93586.1 hypothetical protein [Pseudomonas agarici]